MSGAFVGTGEEVRKLVDELGCLLEKYSGSNPFSQDEVLSLAFYVQARKPTIELKAQLLTPDFTHYDIHLKYQELIHNAQYPSDGKMKLREMLKDIARLFHRWTRTGSGSELYACRLHMKANDVVTWDAQFFALTPEEDLLSLEKESPLGEGCVHRNPKAQFHGCDFGYAHCERGDRTCLQYRPKDWGTRSVSLEEMKRTLDEAQV